MPDDRYGISIREGFLLFWGGWPSNFNPAEFTLHGVTYNRSEQYMMAQKAILFGDDESLHKIMAATKPLKQKELGRKVKGFDQELWKAQARDLFLPGLHAKFAQNPELAAQLVESNGLTLVEASPHDVVWGIGLDRHNPDATDRTKWQGTNWLGECLMQVRRILETEHLAKELSR